MAFLLSWLLEQRPLRETRDARERDRRELRRPQAHRLAGRGLARADRADRPRGAPRAGASGWPSAPASISRPPRRWLIVRLHEDPEADIPALCRSFDDPADGGSAGAGGAARPRAGHADAAGSQPAVGGSARPSRPPATRVAERLIEERRATLARLCEGWSPDDNDELARPADEAWRATWPASPRPRSPSRSSPSPGANSGRGRSSSELGRGRPGQIQTFVAVPEPKAVQPHASPVGMRLHSPRCRDLVRAVCAPGHPPFPSRAVDAGACQPFQPDRPGAQPDRP